MTNKVHLRLGLEPDHRPVKEPNHKPDHKPVKEPNHKPDHKPVKEPDDIPDQERKVMGAVRLAILLEVLEFRSYEKEILLSSEIRVKVSKAIKWKVSEGVSGASFERLKII